MSLADTARATGKAIRTLGVAAALAFGTQAIAATPAAPVAAPAAAASESAAAAPAAAAAAADTADKGSYVPMKPTPGKGQPVDGGWTFQDQYSPIGDQGLWMHDYVLMPVIVAITLLVLILLLVVMAKFRRAANPVASKTSHNTLIEVIWTLIPVLILVVIAVPSIRLLAHQYEPAPKGALTVKVTGYQWYWGYTYPDNGGFEVISNMLPEEEALKRGEPGHLAVDNRMVVPAGEPIRIQTIGSDVIHSFAVPSLWFKLDAVPGRINEKVLFIKEPGLYYGQCSELCGARHGYMPIAVEALPRAKFEAWVKTQPGGTVGPVAEAAPAAVPAAAAAPAEAPAADASAAPAA
ncbi:Cytochrome-c oxidase [Novosphingobium aromaticivorans DSM 12444]|uniref:Cytochrome c oxidase subunit 2 n=1 Tax=Novosphingobium aromaticivorans (strain ATCC 700278 / DSM 12444 / CCUG 56034 / CIP 105152 / NBRC 16084 / F199) TaxID=279238 RepID=Q2G9W5_NOVAD|nr:cytochrome c oxidase subunit II [Novosphingobium aromaticivorans]ABD25358.1 Cytochrome-c oxidase [Novosphingobium aromaticivorans DSM 12444]